MVSPRRSVADSFYTFIIGERVSRIRFRNDYFRRRGCSLQRSQDTTLQLSFLLLFSKSFEGQPSLMFDGEKSHPCAHIHARRPTCR